MMSWTRMGVLPQIAITLLVWGAAVGLELGCSAKAGDQIGGESNWLTACDVDADCDDSACHCGVCTSSCEVDVDCGAAGVRCVDSTHPGLSNACSSVSGLCLAECARDSDCARSQECSEGACLPKALLNPASAEPEPSADSGASEGSGTALDPDAMAPVMGGAASTNGGSSTVGTSAGGGGFSQAGAPVGGALLPVGGALLPVGGAPEGFEAGAPAISGGESSGFIESEEAMEEDCNVGDAQPEDCLCTRRCGLQLSLECYRGSGQSLSQVIGPEGGNITHGLSLTVPVGALSQPTEVIVIESGKSPPTELVDWSPVYVIGFGDAELETSAQMDLPFSNAGNVIPSELGIYWQAEGEEEWVRVSDSYINAGFLQGSLPGAGRVIAGWPSEGDGECVPLPQ